MGRWKLEYYSAGWVELTGTVEETIEELNGHEETTFKIPNTADNRTIVSTDQITRIKFDDTQVFLGALFGVEYSLTQLKCIVYNGVYELLKRRVISKDYVNIPANVIAEDIRVAAGLINPLGSCPTTPISVKFDQTLCFDAIETVADILNKDYWTQNGDTLYIGTRGSSQSFDGTIAKISMRGLDRSKKRGKVHYRGVDKDGAQIMGYAGSGDDVAVFWSSNATTISTLNALAAQKVAEVNSDDSGVTLTCPITSGVHLHPGDTITINKPELNLSGSYKIKKITKHRKTVEVEVSRPKKTTEKILDELMGSDEQALNFGVNATSFEDWESLIERYGPFPKTGIRWTDIWRYLPNINKSLIPASDNTYDVGEGDTPLRWRNIFGVNIFLTYLGPYSDTVAIVQFRTKNKAGNIVLNHLICPTNNEYGGLGSGLKHFKELHGRFLYFYDGDPAVEGTYGGLWGFKNTATHVDDNPVVHLNKELLEFGPGGDGEPNVPDTRLKRIAPSYFEIYKGFGPYADAVATVEFRTQNKIGSAILDHQFIPTDDKHGLIGSETKNWKEVHSVSFFFPDTGYMRCQLPGDNALMQLTKDRLEFGPGGATAPDVYLKRVGTDAFELKAALLQPAGDNVLELGSLTKRFKKIHAVDYAVYSHLSPILDDSCDLGQGGVTPKRWRDLHLSGNLNVAGYTVITSARVLQNVTADAAIITSGQFPLARMPRGDAGKYIRGYGAGFDPMYASISVADLPDLPTSKITSGRFPLARLPEGTVGYVLEAEGTGFDPMYVNPNGRYQPASHNHAGEVLIPDSVIADHLTAYVDITTGVIYTNYLNNCMPSGGANSGQVGNTTTYWNVIAGNSVWYKALGQFDFLDDLAIIKKLRTKGKDKNGLSLIDPASLPPEITQNGLINAGNLTGLLIGAIKQLAAEVESLKKQIKGG